MPHCPYIGADCDKMGNAFACDQVRAVACHERREKLLKEKEAGGECADVKSAG